MKYKTAFRLAMRAFGVYLCVSNALWAIQHVLPGVFMYLVDRPMAPNLMWYVGSSIGNLFGVAVGLYLFFRGEWIVNLAIPSNRPYCHECGYELTGLSNEGICPECGTAYRRSAAKAENARIQ
jgi:hypothetical protein